MRAVKPGHDLAIRWNDKPADLAQIRKRGGVAVCGYPHQFKHPGGKVLVIANGKVGLVFEALRIEGPKPVRLPNGKDRTGYFIHAKPGSIRSPRGNEPRLAGIRWYAVGQYRYVDAVAGKPILIGPVVQSGDPYIEEAPAKRVPIVFRPFLGTIPGRPRSHPEATLVRNYVDWLNDADGFGNNFIREAGLFVDLFDRRKWRLIEAKASISREYVRMAVGQLMDYRRFYPRTPSVGVLLPKKPTPGTLTYLTENRIVAVWSTPGGRFSDSTEMRSWTLQRRRSNS